MTFLDFLFFDKKGLFCFRTFFGITVFWLPFYFFFKKKGNQSFEFFFHEKFFYRYFISYLSKSFSVFLNIFYFKVKIRGLGYRIRLVYRSKKIFRFFFGAICYFYFFLPKNLVAKRRKRTLLLISSDFFVLRSILVYILFFRRWVPYNLRGIFFPKQILFLKTGKKTF
jgi:hypothetical protein